MQFSIWSDSRYVPIKNPRQELMKESAGSNFWILFVIHRIQQLDRTIALMGTAYQFLTDLRVAFGHLEVGMAHLTLKGE